jgi:hypothetical protein
MPNRIHSDKIPDKAHKPEPQVTKPAVTLDEVIRFLEARLEGPNGAQMPLSTAIQQLRALKSSA